MNDQQITSCPVESIIVTALGALMRLALFIVGSSSVSILHATSSINLCERIAHELARHNDSSFLPTLFSTFSLAKDIIGISILLAYPNFNFGQYYYHLDEVALERVEQFNDPQMIRQTEFHGTIYNPMKLIHNMSITRAIFMREREGGGYEDVNYEGNFFDQGVPDDYFAQLYEKDKILTMRMLDFVIDNQMSGMISIGWLKEFLAVAGEHDFRHLLLKLSEREMTPLLMSQFRLFEERNNRHLKAFLDETLSDDDLFPRCILLRAASRRAEKFPTCKERFPDINWTDQEQIYRRLKTIIRQRPTRSSCRLFQSTKYSTSIWRYHHGTREASATIERELLRYRKNLMSPYHVKVWLGMLSLPRGSPRSQEAVQRVLEILPAELKIFCDIQQ
jgi:hypothetical protein